MLEAGEKTPRKRKSKRTIARHKKAAAERRAEREALRAAKQAEWEAGYPQRCIRYQSRYDAYTERSLERGRQHLRMADAVDWMMDYDTPGARRIAEEIKAEELSVKLAS